MFMFEHLHPDERIGTGKCDLDYISFLPGKITVELVIERKECPVPLTTKRTSETMVCLFSSLRMTTSSMTPVILTEQQTER